MLGTSFKLLASAALLATLTLGATPASAEGKKLVFAVAGIPPIFSVEIGYVAEKEGFFKKYGANVELKPFDNGTAAARAVVSGDVDFALSPTPPVIAQISNADVPLVAIYGMPNPDWVLASGEPGKSCKDLPGQGVGVDSVNGARSVALRAMVNAGCPGIKFDDLKEVALGSGVGPALIAGRLSYSVLHLDDIAEIEAQGKKLNTVLTMKDTNPDTHYTVVVAAKQNLAANRDAFVRALAALIDTAHFMNDPKNAEAVAKIATNTGHTEAVNKEALKQFLAIGFWAVNDDGMPRDKLEATVKLMKKVGAIKPDKVPVSFEQLVDATVWKDANAMVK